MMLMKFDRVFPSTPIYNEPIPGIVRIKKEGPCQVCTTPTTWADVSTKAYVCSEECWLGGPVSPGLRGIKE